MRDNGPAEQSKRGMVQKRGTSKPSRVKKGEEADAT